MSEIDLQKFCEPGRRASHLTSEPWTLGDFSYGLDGHFAVRVPRITLEGIVDHPAEAAAGAAKHIADTLEAYAHVREQAVPIPAIPPFKAETCIVCKGFREVIECDECDGEGSQECNLGHDHECEDCDGHGAVSARFAVGNYEKHECWACLGEGVVPPFYQRWSVPVVLLPQGNCCSLLTLKRLHMLPDAVWYWPEFAAETQNKPIPFWFKGGDGLFMQIRSPGLKCSGALYIGEPAEAAA